MLDYIKIFKKAILIVCMLYSLPLYSVYRVNTDIYEWKSLKTDHFEIIHPEGYENAALMGAETAEKGYLRISKVLKHELSQVIPIIIYPSDIDFQQTNILPGVIPGSVGGFTEFLKHRVVVPFSPDKKQFRHVVVHELVHAFQFDIIKNSGETYVGLVNIPLWYIEGMAEYLSIGFDKSADVFMRDAVLNDIFIDLHNFTRGAAYTQYQFYKQGQSFFYFLEKEYSSDLIRKIFTDTLLIGNFAKAVEKNTKKSVTELSIEWHRYFKKIYFPKIAEKNYDDENVIKLTRHIEERRNVYSAPSVSPDGKFIAYLSTGKFSYNLFVAEIKNNRIVNEKKIDTADLTGTDYLNISTNVLNWTKDGGRLLYCKRVNNRDVLTIYDFKKEKFVFEFVIPTRNALYPAISSDSKKVVFVSDVNTQRDLYCLYLKDKTIEKITNNIDVESDPSFDDSSSLIYYVSKENKSFYGEEKSKIIQYNIDTGDTKTLLESEYNYSSPKNYNGKLYYVSDEEGADNLYSYDLETNIIEKHTNSLIGVYNPVFSQNKVFYTVYNYSGFDIVSKDKLVNYEKIENDRLYYFNETENYNQNAVTGFYSPPSGIYKDYLFFMVGGTVGYGIAGVAAGSYSDLLGEKEFNFTTEILYYDSQNREINYDVQYMLKKYRTDYYIRGYRQKNPFGIYSVSSFNDFINNTYHDLANIYYYGVETGAIYPLNMVSALGISSSFENIEYDYSDLSGKQDVKKKIISISTFYNYSDADYALFGPVNGQELSVKYEESFTLDKESYRSIELATGKYFLLGNISIFSLNFSMGKYFGENAEDFSLGGYNSLRVYNYGKFSGRQYFLFTAEFEFILIKYIVPGFLPNFVLSNIGFSVFTDIGSAWSGDYSFPDNGKLNDLKTVFGYGYRFHINPQMYLKLDFSYPFDGKNFGEKVLQFSIAYK